MLRRARVHAAFVQAKYRHLRRSLPRQPGRTALTRLRSSAGIALQSCSQKVRRLPRVPRQPAQGDVVPRQPAAARRFPPRDRAAFDETLQRRVWQHIEAQRGATFTEHQTLTLAVRAIVLTLFALAIAAPLSVGAQVARPLPALRAVAIYPLLARVGGSPPQLPWPDQGGAAISVPGLGTLGSEGDTGPWPSASVAKILTALVVLDDHPLDTGEGGPAVPIGDSDVAAYQRERAGGDSVVAVQSGEEVNESQLLEALLIGNGNNIADILASWDAASLPSFVAKLNSKAAALGLSHTHIVDANGNSAEDTTTATDLLRLAQIAMSNSTFAGIVGQAQADLPVAGTVYNANNVLGQDGIVGIKADWTPESQASFLFAADVPLGSSTTVSVFGVITGQTYYSQAFAEAAALARAVRDNVQSILAIDSSRPLLALQAPWGGHTTLVPAESVALLGWPGVPAQSLVQMPPAHAPLRSGTQVGRLSVQLRGQQAAVMLRTTASVGTPGLTWQLERGCGFPFLYRLPACLLGRALTALNRTNHQPGAKRR
jgi:serine-type D-Ala-D-Ala carboxypeptidase (penicillin-binding protein 5/6)